MIFLPGAQDCDETVFEDQPPPALRHLLLTGAEMRYVHGSFGSYLSQWIGNDEINFYLHYFFVAANKRLFARVAASTVMLHFVLKGSVDLGLYHGDSIGITDRTACFFFLPDGVEHSIDFKGGPVVSMHFNYQPAFFLYGLKQYTVLQELLSKASGNKNIAIHELPVLCAHEEHYLWKSLPSYFRNSSLRDALLSEKGRAVLRLYCAALMVLKEQQACPGIKGISAKHLLLVKTVRAVIEADLKIHYSLQQLACNTHWNVFQLKKNFLTVYGITPYQYLVQRRMVFGEHLVMSTSESIGSIARDCGYRQEHHFIKLFRQAYGTTPSAMRKEIKK